MIMQLVSEENGNSWGRVQAEENQVMENSCGSEEPSRLMESEKLTLGVELRLKEKPKVKENNNSNLREQCGLN